MIWVCFGLLGDFLGRADFADCAWGHALVEGLGCLVFMGLTAFC